MREASRLRGHGNEVFQRRADVGEEVGLRPLQTEKPVGAEGLHQPLGGGEQEQLPKRLPGIRGAGQSA